MRFAKTIDRLLQTLCVPGLLDAPYIWIKYVREQRRVPKRDSGLFNDYLYFRKSSAALSDVLCQVTSDKILVKEYVAARLGQGTVVPVLAIFDDPDRLNFENVPKPCVIKSSHGSGDVVFLKEPARDVTPDERAQLAQTFHSSPYTTLREKNYKHLRRRLVCEPMLPDAEMIKDYKFFCYKGRPRLIQVDSSRFTGHKRNLYDAAWKPLDIRLRYPRGPEEPAPERLADMLEWAGMLAADFEFLRVDFFVSGADLFVGELTHCPESAHGRFGSLAQEREFSRLLFADGLR